MESSSWGKREWGTKAVAVNFKARRLTGDFAAKENVFYVSYIEASINKSARKVPVFEHYWFELRITVDPVIIQELTFFLLLEMLEPSPVSYTHLTLPTIYSV